VIGTVRTVAARAGLSRALYGARLCLVFGASAAAAQARPDLPVAAPSRADSLLARGRLRAAEDALYAAVNANPRAPAARGELGRYLASRARFVIADVLYAEALRFGADTPSIAQARMRVADFRPELDRRRIPGVRLPAAEAAREAARVAARDAARASREPREPRPAANDARAPFTVPMILITDGIAIGSFEVRGPGGTRRAVLDARVRGLLVSSAADSALAPRAFGATTQGAPLLVPEMFIGEQRLVGVPARVDREVPEGEVRVGFDVLWPLRPAFDEREGTMTLSPDAPRAVPDGAIQIPFALGFPGIWLVPVVGEAPVPIASARGRALLRASRWWWDGPAATIVVDR
jgi:hypothetical protein